MNSVRLCSLWKNKNEETGETTFKGDLAPGLYLMVFKNKDKTTDKHPDYKACVKTYHKSKDTGMMVTFTGLWKEGNYLQGKTKDGALLQVRKVEGADSNQPQYAAYIVGRGLPNSEEF